MPSSNKANGIKILIVGESKEACLAIGNTFLEFGFNIFNAFSVREALDILNKEKLNIIISDQMPEYDGFYLLNKVREKNRDYPYFYFTSGDSVDVAKCYSLGMDGFFEKPFNVSSVKKVIVNSLLDKRIRWKSSSASNCRIIKKRFYNLEKLLESNEISLGKGGFFLHLEYDVPKVGERIGFEIEFASRNPLWKIVGDGVVRWRRDQSHGELISGVGLEISHLESDCMKFYTEYINKCESVEFIPLTA